MSKTIIIAEAGVNHNGNLELAKQLIDVAAEAKVDIVKFQTFKAEKLVSKSAPKAEYQRKNISDGDDNQFKMLKQLELDHNSHIVLIDHCRKKNIQFLSTPFDTESADELEQLGISIFKIPSGEITNLPYLKHIGHKGKQVALSTGMSTMEEVEQALAVLTTSGTKLENITVLHCNTEYPTPMEDVNLNAMITMRERFKVKTGYSDHTPGIEVPIAAVALGAIIIEKHFTLDRNMPGPDHKASLEPSELKAMVKAIRNIEAAMGNGIKIPSSSENKNKNIARKSIHLGKSLKKGDIIKEEHIIMLRPGDGISPFEIDKVVGKKLIHDLPIHHQIRLTDIQ